MINTGPSTFERFNESREKLWTVRWQSAVASIYDKGDFSGQMKTVDGDIFQKDKLVSRFKAPNGEAVKATETLRLTGGVTITNADATTTLTCDEIEYDGKKKRIRAVGHVAVKGQMGNLDGVDEIWTDPELNTLATPDLWTKTNAPAYTGSASFASADGTMKMSGGSLRIDKTSEDKYRVLLTKSIRFEDKTQQMTLNANTATLDLSTVKGKAQLNRATTSGNVTVQQIAASGNTAKITGPNAIVNRINSATFSIQMSGGVTILNSNPLQSLQATGPSLTATLNSGKGAEPVSAATLKGGVKITLQQKEQGKVNASGNTLTLDNSPASRTLRLQGNASLEGGGITGIGTIHNVSVATMKLDSEGKVTSVEVN